MLKPGLKARECRPPRIKSSGLSGRHRFAVFSEIRFPRFEGKVRPNARGVPHSRGEERLLGPADQRQGGNGSSPQINDLSREDITPADHSPSGFCQHPPAAGSFSASIKTRRPAQYRGTFRSISSDQAVIPPLTLLTYLNPCWRRKFSAFIERTPPLQCK